MTEAAPAGRLLASIDSPHSSKSCSLSSGSLKTLKELRKQTSRAAGDGTTLPPTPRETYHIMPNCRCQTAQPAVHRHHNNQQSHKHFRPCTIDFLTFKIGGLGAVSLTSLTHEFTGIGVGTQDW
eukprot:4046183-Amphidinium_carterae.1